MQNLFLIIILESISICCGIPCMLDAETPVDWFIVYKMPRMRRDAIHKVQDAPFRELLVDGSAYYYMDSNMNFNWRRGNTGIDTWNNPLIHTLRPIYNPNMNPTYMMYNDQPPEGSPRSKYGHSKGVVAFDDTDGFWLIHSTPRFPPPVGNAYSFPGTGKKFGQIFFCVTYPRNESMAIIGQQVKLIKGSVYGSRNINLNMLKTGIARRRLYSRGNVEIIHFAKTANDQRDLYNCIVAEDLGANLAVETWRRPFVPLATTYRPESARHVHDITEVSINNEIKFRGTKDHSKWAISDMHNWICIGDLNRMESQTRRSGGIACMQNPHVWKTFNNTAVTTRPIIYAYCIMPEDECVQDNDVVDPTE